uniref:Uncharacterized protein n=1 Tax=Anopheles melas TaxID=34690 RepID=A0A182TIL2_9DIPT
MSTVQDHVATTVAAATAAMVGCCLVLAGVIGSVDPAVNGFKGAYRNDHYVQGTACKGCLLRFGLARKSQPMPSFIPQNAVAQRVEKFAPPHAASAHRVSEASRARPILTRRRSLLPPDRTDHAVSVLIFSQVNCIRFAYYFYNMKITLPFPFN